MAGTWPELHSGTNFNYIWDVGTLAWIKQTASGGGGGTADVQYVEQDPSPSPATGTAPIMFSAGSFGALIDLAAGDDINLVPRVTVRGEQFVKHLDTVVANDAVMYANGNTYSVGSTGARVPLSVDQNTHLRVISAPLTTALEYDGAGNPIYIGYAPQGSSKAGANWQVRKMTFDGSNNMTDLQYANGSQKYDQVWNDRATFTYS